MKTVYLAGPIFGKSDGECMTWRNRANSLLGIHDIGCIDPMFRDYRGIEEDAVEEIIAQDKAWIEQCSLVLVNANEPSWGTAMECFYAISLGKRVIAFTNAAAISPWLRCHTTAIFGTLEEAVGGILFGEVTGMR